jgi:superfamily II DNA or RNA helicase/HKD family nuclease
MSKTRPGLYDTLITEALSATLATLDRSLVPVKDELRAAEASDRISLHIARLVARAVDTLGENERAKAGLVLARRLVAEIHSAVAQAEVAAEQLIETGEVLQAITRRKPDGTPETVAGPLIPLLDTTLLTNAPGEPRVGSQLVTEIESADAISIVMAFIRYSGLRPLIDALKNHCAAGKPLRVLTTIYTGSTEARALDALVELGATVRVSYDTTATRLHAKGWMFERHSGFSTAYIGSSNLTHSAQHDGLEWNVRISGARNPSVVEKLSAVFESYWSSPDFEPYVHAEFEARLQAQSMNGSSLALSPIELIPQPFQERLLEQIQVSRQLGHHRNLLVAATGTGKTVMAALDYAHLQLQLPRSRLLFVAHREEILQKSLDTFRIALRDYSFGELWVGGKRPVSFDHVFASIQSLSATGFDDLPAGYFDVVIVDEFHHAAAKSYTSLLSHVQPFELLGLTATPERGDGLPLLHWFDNRIAAELRLWDAIEQHRLCPFAYYGIHDGIDLRDVPWRRGRGYDADGLTNVLTAEDARAHLVAKQLHEHVTDVSKMRALGFCVSVKHAQFMARVFNKIGIPSVAVFGETDRTQRVQALQDLEAGRINVVFAVDLFNEGVDVPTVDALLLLRPTESATLFLQQLGRGLRKHRTKSACTVLDFVGQHRKEFRFDQRFRALLGGSRADVIEQIKKGFPFLPAGCHMQLDRVASEIVIESIKRAIPSRWVAKVEELLSMRRNVPDATLAQYLDYSGLDVEDIYESNHSWSELREAAGLPVASAGPENDRLRRACGRMLHIDDLSRIDSYQQFLSSGPPDPGGLSTHDQRLLRMLVASVTDSALEKDTSLKDATHLLWSHPQIIAELRETLGVLRQRVNHVHHLLGEQTEVPLRVHGRYTRTEILSGFGVGNAAMPPDWREGVRFARDSRADLFVFTLDKTDGQFSPTTRYKDYAISRDLIHWESQSTVRETSETGQRYQNHVSMGTSVMLFARLRSDDRAFWFLGPATYVSHTGELPMAITWKLHHPLPGDLFAQFAAAVA